MFINMEVPTHIWIISIILCLKQEAAGDRKFVLHNDMSEHCRRRVVSSIFLGRQVADSSAKVMHFSRLDMPYSCSISVRTESGSNIILVILSQSEDSIISGCRKEHDQVLVYEMGETFGGYWGALPEDLFERETRNQSTYYTLKPTEASSTYSVESTENERLQDIQNIVPVTTSTSPDTEGDYVIVEVPLVNVSGNIQLGESEVIHDDADDLFDLIYDVTPKNGVLYDTSVMPLVQFSIWTPKYKASGHEDRENRYQLDYNVQEYTPDRRLLLQTNNHKRKLSYRPYYSTKRLKFKNKKNNLFSVYHKTSRIHLQPEHTTELITTLALRNGQPLYSTTFENHTDTWKLIESYLKLLNRDNITHTLENMDDEALALLRKISNMKHNVSVYLQPNLTKYKDLHSTSKADKKTVTHNKMGYYEPRIFLSTLPIRNNVLGQITKSTYSSNLFNDTSMAKVKVEFNRNTTMSRSTSYLSNLTTTSMMPVINNHQKSQSAISQSTPVLTLNSQSGAITKKQRKSVPGSLVDHESWENIVQVAPVIADLLNVNTAFVRENTTHNSKTNRTPTPVIGSGNKINRKKRYIQALSIDRHRPRQFTTKEFAPKPEKNINQINSQKLAELVELQDDEIQGRVALRYFKQYAGPMIFNMCDYSDGKTRQVFLFNSSRVVIAINNFTMDRITIVMTESRVARGAGCPMAHLECQVAGVRVCVHNMNACDGLPNCGAYDIYDEDRMLCSNSGSFHYTVCLAACTFLVMLLTFLYSVHYWLKRCIPKVSQAFFLYTDKSENILYLDTIMRSPNVDFDGGSRLVYHSSFFEDDVLSTGSMKSHGGKFLNVVKRFYRFLFCKKHKLHSRVTIEKDISTIVREPKRTFSFTEAELRKIGQSSTRNVSIQTGDSLEMALLKNINKKSNFDAPVKPNKRSINQQQESLYKKETIHSEHSEKELTTLRRLQRISSSLHSRSKDSVGKIKQDTNKYPANLDEEVELQSTLYERGSKRPELRRHVLDIKKYDDHLELQRKMPKHLRFDEKPINIASSAIRLDKHESQKTSLDADRYSHTSMGAMEEAKEIAGTSGRDFRRFWGKGKKNKKKTQLSLH